MADTYTFTVNEETGDQEAPVQARLYQSTTINGAQTEVVTVTLASLGYTGNPPEELTWVVSAADPTKYSWLVPVAQSGREGQPALLGPAPVSGNVSLEFWSESIIGVAQAGISVEVRPHKEYSGYNDKVLIPTTAITTNASGYATVNLYADSGNYSIFFNSKCIIPKFSTAGLTGQTIQVGSLLG